MALISVDQLARRLNDPDLRIVDVRWYLNRPGQGRQAYESGHIPGAIFLDLDEDLSGEEGPGRHPLPHPLDFRRRLEAAGIGDEHPHVHQHPHGHQEERYEEGVAEEVDPVDERPLVRDQRVQDEADEEGADDGLNAGDLRQVRADEDDGEDEHVLARRAAHLLAEEPAREAGHGQDDEHDVYGQGNEEPRPEGGVQDAAHGRGDHRQDQERRGVGDQGAADGGGHRGQARDAEPAGDGIRHERVGPEHAGQQDGGQQRIAEGESDADAHELRQEIADAAERQRVTAIATEAVEIDLGPRHEDEVEQPHRAEQDEGLIPREQVQRVRPDQRPGHDEPDQAGDPEPCGEERRRQEYGCSQAEDQDGARDRQADLWHTDRRSVR
jgi:hypothetical protein